MQFNPTLDNDEIMPAPEFDTKETHAAGRRHVRILKPGRNSHRRPGQVYLQRANEQSQ